MELIWKRPTEAEAAEFDNDTSPYAHYWMAERDADGPACGADPTRQTIVGVAQSLSTDIDALVSRAFKP